MTCSLLDGHAAVRLVPPEPRPEPVPGDVRELRLVALKFGQALSKSCLFLFALGDFRGLRLLVIRQLVAPGSYERGWSTSTDLVERRGGNFELLSRAIIRRLTSEAELSRTMKDPASLVACANPDWIVVEVRSASHLPLFLRRQASCLEPDPLGDVEGLVNRMIAEARKSPPPAVR